MTGNWKSIGKLAARLAGLADNEETRQRANAPGHDRQERNKAMNRHYTMPTDHFNAVFNAFHEASSEGVGGREIANALMSSVDFQEFCARLDAHIAVERARAAQ